MKSDFGMCYKITNANVTFRVIGIVWIFIDYIGFFKLYPLILSYFKLTVNDWWGAGIATYLIQFANGIPGSLPDNVANFGTGAINPRKGDSSCYPRVMLKAYPWRKCISCWLNPGVDWIAIWLAHTYATRFRVALLWGHRPPRPHLRCCPRLPSSCPFRAKYLS